MNKGTHFIGQPLYGQLINLLDKSKILGFSRDEGGEHYVKHFDGWQHLSLDTARSLQAGTFGEQHDEAEASQEDMEIPGNGNDSQNNVHILH